MRRFQNIGKVISFLLILSLLLMVVSKLSLRLDRGSKILYDYSPQAIFYEPDYSLDVFVIGDSNVYSSVSPLLWWQDYGFTGFAWGTGSQTVYESYENIKKVLRHQKPKVVFIEASNVFREKSNIDNANSLLKAKFSAIFPVISYHKRLDINRINSFYNTGRSLTKGYFLRQNVQRTRIDPVREKLRLPTNLDKTINPISQRYLEKSIDYCRKKGSEVVLLYIPSYNRWSCMKHNALKKTAKNNHVPFLDLNLILMDNINWKKDSVDGGAHLNLSGAKKVTNYLGNYIYKKGMAEDHRKDNNYKLWDYYLKKFNYLLEKQNNLKKNYCLKNLKISYN